MKKDGTQHASLTLKDVRFFTSLCRGGKCTRDGGKLRLRGKIRCQGGEVTSSGSGSRAYRRDSTLGGKDYISATRVKSEERNIQC